MRPETEAPGDIVEQTRQIFRKFERLLQAAGGSCADIVSTGEEDHYKALTALPNNPVLASLGVAAFFIYLSNSSFVLIEQYGLTPLHRLSFEPVRVRSSSGPAAQPLTVPADDAKVATEVKTQFAADPQAQKSNPLLNLKEFVSDVRLRIADQNDHGR